MVTNYILIYFEFPMAIHFHYLALKNCWFSWLSAQSEGFVSACVKYDVKMWKYFLFSRVYLEMQYYVYLLDCILDDIFAVKDTKLCFLSSTHDLMAIWLLLLTCENVYLHFYAKSKQESRNLHSFTVTRAIIMWIGGVGISCSFASQSSLGFHKM